MSANSPIDLSVDDETKLIMDALDEFVEQEVKPIADDLGDVLTNPRKGFEDDGRLTDEVLDAINTIRQKSAEAGFYAMNMPEEVGGEDVSYVSWYRVNKHLAKKDVPLAGETLAGPAGPKPLLANAEGEQVEKYLKPAMRAEKTTAFGQTEPGVGSDSPNMETSAEKDGDEWVINGQKQWITNAPYADFIQVFARTTPQEEAGRYGGITCFIVESDEYEIGSLNNVPSSVGRQAEVILDDVRVSEDRILGEPDNAFYDAMEFLGLGRVEIGARAVGQSEYLIDRMVEYANQREAFGQKIGEFQQVSAKIAEAKINTYAADGVGLKCAYALDQGEPAIIDSSALKYFATNTFWDIADDAVQVHGANGLSEDNIFMNKLEGARMLRVVEGTDEIQLNTVAGQLGLR